MNQGYGSGGGSLLLVEYFEKTIKKRNFLW
jgi:hypothetical protein